jgi:hypothetical protein
MIEQEQVKKRGVGAPFRGRKFVQMRLLDSYTPDEIDYLREYSDSVFPNLVALRRAKLANENQVFQTAQAAQKSMQSTEANPQTLQLLINMTGTDTDKLTNAQHAQVFAVSKAGVSEFIYIPNSRKSANTRAQYVVEKMRELAKKHKQISTIIPVVAYPADAESIKAYMSLKEEINAQLGKDDCKALAL